MTSETSREVTPMNMVTSPPKPTTTTTLGTPSTTTSTKSPTSEALSNIFLLRPRPVMWWPQLLPWHYTPSIHYQPPNHHQQSGSFFKLPAYPLHQFHHPSQPHRLPLRQVSQPKHPLKNSSPSQPAPKTEQKTSQTPLTPASTTPLYLSTWLLPSHLLYKYTSH